MVFDVELIRRFAEGANYSLEIITEEFPVLIPALASGTGCSRNSPGEIQERSIDKSGTICSRNEPEGISIDSSKDEVFHAYGDPVKVVDDVEGMKEEDGVLYKNYLGVKDRMYYQRSDKGIRLFFKDDAVVSLYLMRTQ